MPNRAMSRLQNICLRTSNKLNVNIVLLPLMARSPDMALIEHVWDMFGCNARYNDVRIHPQMITALRR